MGLANEQEAGRPGLTPRARMVGMAIAGVAPRIMRIAPAPVTRKVFALTGPSLAQTDGIDLNEAFIAQGLALRQELGAWLTRTRAPTPTAVLSR